MPVGSPTVVGMSCLIGLIVSSLYFSYHAPGALEISLKSRYNLSSKDVSLLFTLYSLPNIVLPAVAGHAIDRFGLKRVGIVLLVFITAGSAIFALASQVTIGAPLRLMMIGRLVLGLGGESIVTFQQAASNFWFSGPYESLSLGTCLAVQQSVGSAVSFFILEDIAKTNGVVAANWFVVFVCGVAIFLFFMYTLFERFYKDYLVNEQKRTLDSYPLLCCFCLRPSKRDTALTVVEVDGIEAKLSFCEAITTFNRLFWMENVAIFFIVPILYVSANFFPFFLRDKFGMNAQEAGKCASMIYWFVIAAPFFGALSDRIGQRLWFQIFACVGAIAGFVLLFLGVGYPWHLVSWVGLMFAILEQNSYSLLARTFENLPANIEGTGYGIMGLFLNGGLCIVPPLVGVMAEATGNYACQNLLYAAMLAAGLLTSLAMKAVDSEGVLDLTSQMWSVPQSPRLKKRP